MKKPPASPGRFRVVLFGGPTVHRDSREVALSPYQRAAVGIVYGHGAVGLPRDRLIWLLWEADDAAQSRHGLSQLLYAVAGRLGRSTVLLTRGDQVLPNETAVQSDLCNLDLLTQSGRYVEAAKLIDAGFLAGLGSVSRELDDWRDARVLALRSKLRDAAAKAWADSEEAADWARAREAAEALLLLDPDSEPYLRCVMKARALTGAPEEAEAAFRGWVERQGRDGRVPGSITKALLGRTAAIGATTPRQPSACSGDPPFVGRLDELRTLRAAFASPPPNRVATFLVTGEAGIGKTRLVAEACFAGELEGLKMLRATCTALGQQIPLNPLIDALLSADVNSIIDRMQEPWRTVCASLVSGALTEGPSRLPQAEPPTIKRRLFEAIQMVLEGLVAKQPCVLWIDDLQWADDTTVSAIEFVTQRWRLGSLVLCLTARDEQRELTSTPRVIDQLRIPMVRMTLADLGEIDAAALVRNSLGPAATEQIVRKITSLGPRNPFYLVELSLEYQQGRRGRGSENPSDAILPLSIQHILIERLSHTTSAQRRVLEILSVSGEVSVGDLRTIACAERAQLSADLMTLLDLRLVRYAGAGVQVAHELLRQVVYGALEQAQRSFLHHQVAESLKGAPSRRVIGQIAIHLDLAGVGAEACQFARAAAHVSQEEGALPETIRFLRIARRNTADPADAAELLAREGQALLHLGDDEAALGVITIAERELRTVGKHADAVLCATLRLGLMSKLAILEHTDCAKQLELAVGEAEALGRWDLFLRALETKMRVLERDGDIAELRRTAHAADRVPADCGPEVQCMAQSLRALDVLFGGGESATQAAVAALRTARERNLDGLVDKVEYRLFVTLLYAGALDTPGAPYSVDDCLALAKRTGDFWIRVNCYTSVACWMLDSGNLDAASHRLADAAAILGEHDEGELLSKILVNKAELALYEGDFDQGMEHGLNALSLPYNSKLPVDKMIAQAAVGLCALKAGNLSVFWQVAREFKWTGDTYFECSLPTWFCVELARARGKVDEGIGFLRQTAEGLKGRLHLTWIKLVLLDLEYTWRRDPPTALRKATEARSLSSRLGLQIRSEQLDRWIRKLEGLRNS